jgi:CheY-like chemotaxis protein
VCRSPRVLIADDDDDIRVLIEEMLSTAGLITDAVPDATAALQRSRIEPAELYVLDVQMPDISGIELCRQLKAEQPDAARVIMISAQASAADLAAAAAAGCDAYLTKPFSRKALLEQVNTLLAAPKHP